MTAGSAGRALLLVLLAWWTWRLVPRALDRRSHRGFLPPSREPAVSRGRSPSVFAVRRVHADAGWLADAGPRADCLRRGVRQARRLVRGGRLRLVGWREPPSMH